MAKKNPYPHLDVFKKYEALVADFPEVERKGVSMPYTALNGNMFSFLDKEGMLSLRFSQDTPQSACLPEAHHGPHCIRGFVVGVSVCAIVI